MSIRESSFISLIGDSLSRSRGDISPGASHLGSRWRVFFPLCTLHKTTKTKSNCAGCTARTQVMSRHASTYSVLVAHRIKMR